MNRTDLVKEAQEFREWDTNTPYDMADFAIMVAERESIAFAEWLRENEWKRGFGPDTDKWSKFFARHGNNHDFATTSELYAIYKEQNG